MCLILSHKLKYSYANPVYMITYFKKTKKAFLNFLFPPPLSVYKLENMSEKEILEVLPRSIDLSLFANSIFSYKNPLVKEAIKHIKFRGNSELISKFGKIMYEELSSYIPEYFGEDSAPYMLIPIPLSRKRFTDRGFNQSELLCEAIMANDNENMFELIPRALKRSRNTKPQAKLKRRERLKNVKNCFYCSRPELVRNRKIVLIDDVSTTGSTLRDARRALIESGVAHENIIAFTLAG